MSKLGGIEARRCTGAVVDPQVWAVLFLPEACVVSSVGVSGVGLASIVCLCMALLFVARVPELQGFAVSGCRKVWWCAS